MHETKDEAALLLAIAGIGRAADLGAVDRAALEGVLVLGPDQDELIAVAAPGALPLALGPVAAGEGAVRPEGVDEVGLAFVFVLVPAFHGVPLRRLGERVGTQGLHRR